MSDESPRSTPPMSSDSDEDGVQNTTFGNNLESEPEGEDLAQTIASDYRARPELDRYEEEGLDNGEYAPLTALQLASATEEIARRRETDAFWSASARNAIEAQQIRNMMERPNQLIQDMNAIFETPEAGQSVFLQDITGPLQPYLERQEVKIEIGRKFRLFIQEFKDADGNKIYLERIKRVATTNQQSFEVSYLDLSQHNSIIGVWIGDAPDIVIPILSEAALLVVNRLYPNLNIPKITVRITHLPLVDRIRDLRQMHLNCLIRTRGVVTRVYDILPHLMTVRWRCTKCGQIHGPFEVVDDKAYPPAFCASCNSRSGFEIDDATTIYRNFQRITVQEPPGLVEAGRLPRTKEVVLLDDNAGTVRPGEEIDITGIYKHMMHTKPTGFPVFSTIIEANYILKSGDEYASLAITEAEKEQIIKLSKDPNIAERIFNTIAPSIHGHEDIKAAIALALFGGTRLESEGHTVRGDINIILLGDPGTAKSQFLKFAHDIAPRSVYTTGKGASAVGLTAAVTRDHASGEYTIEGGALVLADSGVCVIDEFDKMSDKDRTSLHEAMEQQTISISKGGIVTTLQARCSVIAACNPTHDRYQPALSFLENSGLTEPILSRFDVVCVVRDIVDYTNDQKLAEFVCNTHKGVKQPSGDIPQDLLKKYISYARATVHTQFNPTDKNKLVNLYTELRKKSEEYGGQSITMRNYESMIRLAEAHARLHLRSNVTDEDANFAMKLIIESFISTQKYSTQKNMRKAFEKYITPSDDKNDLLMHLLHQMINERATFLVSRRGQADADIGEIRIKIADFANRAQESQVENVSKFFASSMFKSSGFYIDEDKKAIVKPAE